MTGKLHKEQSESGCALFSNQSIQHAVKTIDKTYASRAALRLRPDVRL